MALGRESSASQLGYYSYPDLSCQGSQGHDSYVVLPRSCVSRAGFQPRDCLSAQRMGWPWSSGLVSLAACPCGEPWAPPGSCEIATTHPGSQLWWFQGAEGRGEHVSGRFPTKTRTKVILFYNIFCVDVCTLR